MAFLLGALQSRSVLLVEYILVSGQEVRVGAVTPLVRLERVGGCLGSSEETPQNEQNGRGITNRGLWTCKPFSLGVILWFLGWPLMFS